MIDRKQTVYFSITGSARCPGCPRLVLNAQIPQSQNLRPATDEQNAQLRPTRYFKVVARIDHLIEALNQSHFRSGCIGWFRFVEIFYQNDEPMQYQTRAISL